MGKTIKENMQSTAVKAALSFLDSNPEENIPKLINVVEKLDVVADKLWQDNREICKMEKGTA